MIAKRSVGTIRSLTLFNALLMTTAFTVPAFAEIETVVVTAEKKSEDIQAVPIAVTAYTSKDLAEHQITQFKDLQFSTPNVSYTKGNFTGSDFQIRGIGLTAVGNDSESGVAIHQNDVYLSAPPLAEASFYDLSRVEVLRGPQSTLYGRGATGGAVNIITAKPDLDLFSSDAEASYGNYNATEIKGMVNLPLVDDQLAVRIAGDWVKHDGYVTNVADGSHIDGRNQYSIRGSIRWEPTSDTTIDLVGAYSNEADSRMRGQKQLCDSDPTGVLGCLPNGLADQPVNVNSNASVVASSRQAFGNVGALVATEHGFSPGSAGYNATVATFSNLGLFDLSAMPTLPAGYTFPTDPRQVFTDFNPTYHARDTFVSLNVKQTLNSWLDATFVGGFDQDSLVSQESYNNIQGLPIDPTTLAVAEGTFDAILAGAGAPPAYIAAYAPYFSHAGQLPISAFTNLGIINNNVKGYSSNVTAYDQSDGGSQEWSGELRFNSNFDGPLNFMAAGYYLHTKTHTDYFVGSNTLDYPAIIAGGILGSTLNPVQCSAAPCVLAPTFYDNDGAKNTLESKALFGEVYYDAIPDTLKFTVGLRYTEDEKFQQARIVFASVPVPIGQATIDPTIALATTAYCGTAAQYDADPSTAGCQPFEVQRVGFKKTTGRAVVDWTPKLDFTDATLVYASYSRGYKAGGFNPGIQSGLTVPTTYSPESIDAYELGTKNTLLDGTVQANLTAWYYDYKNLQVSSILANTSVNENINAKLYGFEGEMLWAASDKLQFNLNIGTTHSSIGNESLVDTRNPTGGRSDVVLIKDANLGGAAGTNCVLYMTGGQTVSPAELGLPQLGFFSPPGGPSSLAGAGVAHANFGFCPSDAPPAVVAALNALGYSYTDTSAAHGGADGSPVNLKGHQLQNTPDASISIGAQYTQPVGDYNLAGRVDYYWQAAMWARIFNDPADRIKSWDVANAQLTLSPSDDRWYVQAFVKNIFDKANVTGEYLTSATSGLYTNEFLGDPRTYGIRVGAHL